MTTWNFIPYSVASRLLAIPFANPTVGPTNAHELRAYKKLTKAVQSGKYSSAIGWLVSLEKELGGEGYSRIEELQEELGCNSSQKERNVNGWCICLYFLEKVSEVHNNIILYYLIIIIWLYTIIATKGSKRVANGRTGRGRWWKWRRRWKLWAQSNNL